MTDAVATQSVPTDQLIVVEAVQWLRSVPEHSWLGQLALILPRCK